MSHEPVLIRYFAWVRERIGLAEERLALPDSITTAGELVAWLAARDEVYAHALEAGDSIRVAVDQFHVDHDETIVGAREIAIFPPMTGG